ncbi:ferric reductase NAD binding domain-containing protein [Geopyxis carbonaria]|nr:ferric reductase NAD binding domain-containing protein [Geopyxis carbonaria]
MAAQTGDPWWRRELTGRKLLFWIFWFSIHFGLFGYGWWKQYTDQRLAALNGLSYSVWISRGAGLALSFDGGLILLPMCRNVIRVLRPKIRFIPLDESQWLHRQTAYSMLFFTIVHTAAHYVNFYSVEKTQVRPVTALQIHYAQAGGVTGHVMLFCMLLMFTTAHSKIRQQCYEAFWYTHHLFIIFMLGFYTHATGCFVRDDAPEHSPFAGKEFWDHCIGYQSWRFTLWAGGLYLAERLYREIRSRRQTEITRLVRHPYNAMELQFSKPSMKYKSGQWLFLQVPAVSKYQWHPFTITSCPSDPYISVHIRQVGDFTKQLAEVLGVVGDEASEKMQGLDPNGVYEIAMQNGKSMPALKIDGPYGAPAEDVFDNEIAVLVGTGIGVTPWASILKNIWHKRNYPDRNAPMRLRRVEFIWVCRDTSSFEWFNTLLKSLERQSNGQSKDFLRIHTYLTQKLDVDTAQNIVLNSVGQEVDPLTQLRTGTQFGRPDFKRIFGALRDGIKDQTYITGLEGTLRTNVGVYFCGPSAAARDIKKSCRAASSPEVNFSFWKEHF